MKNIILAVSMVVVSVVANAQSPSTKESKRTPEERARHQTEVLTRELMLSEDQNQKVLDAALRKEKTAAETKEQRMANQRAFEKELNGILSSEQMEKYESLKEKRKEQLKAKMKENEKAAEEKAAKEKMDQPEQGGHD